MGKGENFPLASKSITLWEKEKKWKIFIFIKIKTRVGILQPFYTVYIMRFDISRIT